MYIFSVNVSNTTAESLTLQGVEMIGDQNGLRKILYVPPCLQCRKWHTFYIQTDILGKLVLFESKIQL